AGGVDRDLMRRERARAEAADQDRDHSEYADLEEELQRGGRAEAQQLANAREIGPQRRIEQSGPVAAVVAPGVDGEHGEHVDPGDAGGPAGASRPQGGRAEIAEYE